MKAKRISIFYRPNGTGSLIGIVGENLKARWYRYSPKRYELINALTIGWNTTYTPIAISFRRP